MSLKTQAKLLRVLQEQVIERGRRVAGSRSTRVVAATNKDLPERVRGTLPRGPVLPAQRGADRRAAAARAAGGHPLLAEHFMAAGSETAGGRRGSTLAR